MFYNPYYQQPMVQPAPDQLNQFRQPYMPQQMQQPQLPVQNSDGRIWVLGNDAAKAYLVAPGCTVVLWDSTRDVFYIKKADEAGRPFMDTFDYSKKGTEAPKESPKINYMDLINGLDGRITALEKGVNNAESNADDPAV